MKFIANKNLRSFSYNGTIISIYPVYAKNWRLKMNHQSNMFINLKLPLHAFQLISLRLLLCYTAHEKLENNVLPHNQPTDTNKEVRLRFFFMANSSFSMDD